MLVHKRSGSGVTEVVFLLIGLMLLSATVASAQENDVSVYSWHNRDEGTATYYPWLVHAGDKVFGQVRFNFDHPNTVTVEIGRSFKFGKEKKLWIAPQAGFMVGNYNGLAPEMVAGYDGRVSVFTMNTYGHTDPVRSGYHYLQVFTKVGKRLQIGVAEEAYAESPNWRIYYDVGPWVKFTIGKTYIVVWPTWGTMNNTYIGVGYTF